jgi:choline kinase
MLTREAIILAGGFGTRLKTVVLQNVCFPSGSYMR